jgi:hypothetical protein
VRFLLLGNSDDSDSDRPPFGAGFRYFERELGRITGAPVEGHRAFAFPRPTLAPYVARLLDRVEPDVVVLHCTGFIVGAVTLFPWVEEYIPPGARGLASVVRRRLSDALGCEVGQPLAAPHSPAQHAYAGAYDALLRAGLGGPYTTPEAAVAWYREAIRVVRAREQTALVVGGPDRVIANRRVRELQRRNERRLVQYDRAMAAVCADLRVPYSSTLALVVHHPWRHKHRDGLHLSVTGQELQAAAELRLLATLLSGS